MIKMHLNSIRSDLLCAGPTSDACKESRPQPTSQIDDVTVCVRVCEYMCVCDLVLEYSGCVFLFQIALLSSELF